MLYTRDHYRWTLDKETNRNKINIINIYCKIQKKVLPPHTPGKKHSTLIGEGVKKKLINLFHY